MTTAGTHTTVLGEVKSRPGIDTLEALLKLGALAYGLGFLTVMLNTAKLGIPSLELLEPVQVWVGIPLALVYWLVLAAYRYFRRHAADLSHDLPLVKSQFDEIQSLAERGDDINELLRKAELVAFRLPYVGLAWVATLRSFLLKMWSLESTKSLEHPALRKLVQNVLAPTIGTVLFLQRVFTFLSKIVSVILILGLATYYYIAIFYPKMPAKWGGGAPMHVTMVLTEEGMPKGDTELSGLFPQSIPEGRDSSTKARRTKPLDLLYATQDAYYIKLDSGKIARISAHAVSAVIFEHS